MAAPPIALAVPPVGMVIAPPPTWREKGAVWALFIALAATICFTIVFYRHYLGHLPVAPPDAARTPADIQAQKLMLDQYRESASFAFDLVVTKTLLPLVTLLLGYLFGKL